MRIVTACMLLLVGCVTNVGDDGLAVGVSEQRLESGLYTRINSTLFSDGDGPANPLSSLQNVDRLAREVDEYALGLGQL